MKEKAYDFVASEDALRFTFESVGPKGRIVKVVLFELSEFGDNVYNMAFGDEGKDGLDDHAVSENGDRGLILATLLRIIQIFFEHRPDMAIYFTGSTPQRKRIYNWIVNRYLRMFQRDYVIFGMIGNQAYVFEKGDSYERFLVAKRKNILTLM